MLPARPHRLGENRCTIRELVHMGRQDRRIRRLAKALFRATRKPRHNTTTQARWPRLHRHPAALELLGRQPVTDVTLRRVMDVTRARTVITRFAVTCVTALPAECH